MADVRYKVQAAKGGGYDVVGIPSGKKEGHYKSLSQARAAAAEAKSDNSKEEKSETKAQEKAEGEKE